MESKMVNATNKEKEFLNNFKLWLGNDLLKSRIASASYLMQEIELQYGGDVLEVMIAHQSSIMQNLRTPTDDITDQIVESASKGYGFISAEVNSAISDVVCSRENEFRFGSDGTALTQLVNKLQESCLKESY
jgi:hypothetical protein